MRHRKLWPTSRPPRPSQVKQGDVLMRGQKLHVVGVGGRNVAGRWQPMISTIDDDDQVHVLAWDEDGGRWVEDLGAQP